LSDRPIRGVGPRGLDQIDRALDHLEGTIEVEKSRVAAVGAILAEHGRLTDALMATVDLCFLVEDGGMGAQQLNRPNLRKATADLMESRIGPPLPRCSS
jgi:hypothetical protein